MISKNWDLNSPLNTNILKMARVLPAWNVSTFGISLKTRNACWPRLMVYDAFLQLLNPKCILI